MSKKESQYDSKNKTMWVFREFDKPKTLVPNDELKEWIDVLKTGKSPQGEPVKHVHYVFKDHDTAAYNFQPLSYAGLGTYVGDKNAQDEYRSEDGKPSFTPQEDFGIS